MGVRILRFLKNIYIFCLRLFFRNGIVLTVGNAGHYRFDHIFALRGFKYFGVGHNSGFNRWIEFCKGKKVVFDVGAHIGLYSIPASSLITAGGGVYAFEPSSANYTYLRKARKP